MQMYRALDPTKIAETLHKLELRIEDRFPEAGLAGVCRELTSIADHTQERLLKVQRPIYWLRMLVGIALTSGALVLLYVSGIIEFKRTSNDLFGVLQGMDAAFNVIVLMGAAFFFLWTVEERVKRRRVLAELHELRSIVHVIDMHQLTKDPSMVTGGHRATAHSPKREMTTFELSRYLDYCTEMLSLVAKVAALYSEAFRDPVVIGQVNEMEQLATNLSGKIWQKIVILQQIEDAAEASRERRAHASAHAQAAAGPRYAEPRYDGLGHAGGQAPPHHVAERSYESSARLDRPVRKIRQRVRKASPATHGSETPSPKPVTD